MRPHLDSSSSSSSYQTSLFSGRSDSSTHDDTQDNNNEQHTARMLTRTTSANPLNTRSAEEDQHSPEKSSADPQYEHAQRRLASLKYAVNEFNRAEHFDLANAQALFNQIKSAEPSLKMLSKEGSDADYGMLAQFAAGMSVCISQFARFLSSGKAISPGLTHEGSSLLANSLLSTLEAQDVHHLCNGLSTLLDDSIRSSLFSKQQLKHLTKPLRDINQALIVQAMLKGLPTDLPSNACLLDILNLQSRLLKAKLVTEDSKAIRALFTRSLAIIEQWPAENSAPVTDAGKVVSRQLAKTLVQLNTIKSFNLIKLDKSAAGQTNKQRLGQCVLALCTEQALEELTLKRNPDKPADQPLRVPPKGVEVSNISNTVKDFIEAGYLSLSDAGTYALVERMAECIIQIPQTDMQQRGGQTLSNCGNFLRTVQECATRPQGAKAILQSTAYQAACTLLLKRIASDTFWSTMGWGAKPDQTLANSASFLKAMVKTGKANVALLQSATAMLIRQIQGYGAENFTEAQSVSGLLSALVAIAYLVPSEPVSAFIKKLLDTVDKQVSGKWPAKSRAVALRAALMWQDEGRRVHAIDALLQAGAVHEDALPYLQAVYLRGKDNPDRLAAFQPMLRQLVAEWAQLSAAITLDDIEQVIRRLESKEPASPPRLHIAPLITPITTTDKKVKPVEPPIPGLTSIMPTTTTPASSHFTTTTSSSSVKPAPRQRNADYSAEPWEEPANVLGNQKQEAHPMQTSRSQTTSTNPVVTTRTSQVDKKSAKPTAVTSVSNPKKVASSLASRQASTTPSVITAKTKATMARQWFEAIQNRGMKNRMAVLEQLVKQYPELPELKGGNGNNNRNALFHALILGDTVLVEWLLPRMQPMSDEDAISLLKLVFDEPIFVEDAMKAAMTILLKRLGTSQSDAIAMELNKHPELIPQAYRAILLQFKPAGYIAEVTASTTTRNEAKKIRRAQDVRREREEILNHTEWKSHDEESSNLAQSLKNLEISVTKVKNRNPLLASVFYGDIDAVNTNLDATNVDAMLIDVEPNTGLTPLLIAIMKSQESIASRLLQMKAGVASTTIRDRVGYTPLMRAIYNKQDGIARMLIALPNVTEQVKMFDPMTLMNPLHVAVKMKNHELARLLAGVPDTEDQALHLHSDGQNALFQAFYDDDPKMMEILLSMPNGLKQFNQIKGISPNMIFNDAVGKKRTKIVELLLKHDDVENWLMSPTVQGGNALTFSISSDIDELAESLLNSPFGERLSLIAPLGGNIPLMIAAKRGKDRIAAMLLTMPTAEQQAMHINDIGLTSLLLAVKKGHIEIVRRLIALPNAKDQASMRHNPGAFHEKFRNANQEKLYDLIKQNLGEWSAVASFAKDEGISLERYLENDKSLEPNDIDTIGMNAWQIATAKGYVEIAALLLPFEKS